MVDVEKTGETVYRVTVDDGGTTSTHTVELDGAYHEKLSEGRQTGEELVRRSFEFLLAREPKEAILSRFHLGVIARYFADFDETIALRRDRSADRWRHPRRRCRVAATPRGTHLIIEQMTLGIAETNCYVVGCESTREGVVVDPSDEAERILTVVRRESLTIRYVLNTHAHFDHILANREVMEATGAPLALHPADLPLLRARGGADLFGVRAASSPDPTLLLEEGMEVAFGEHTFRVLFTPGHTQGHVSFFEAAEGVLFDGDVLFAGGIGRTDLPGGDYDLLMRSIRSGLLALPDETRVYPGHGPMTTIGAERVHNPWIS